MTTEQDAKKALAKLLLCYQQTGDETERKAKLSAYWQVLGTRKPEFVVEACEYAAKGKLGDGRFLPTAAELFQSAEAFAARDMQRRRVYVSKLSVEVPQNDAIAKQRIIAGFSKLLQDLHVGNPIDPDNATKDVFSRDRGREA